MGHERMNERARTFAWIDEMKKLPTRYLRPGEKLLAEKIAHYKPNAPKEGRTIANKFLAVDIGQSERNVNRLKVKLRRKGLIGYEDNEGGFVGGRGKSTTYFLVKRELWSGGLNSDKLSGFSKTETLTNRAVNPDKTGRETLTNSTVNPDKLSGTTTITTLPLTSGELASAPVEGALARPKPDKKEAADEECWQRVRAELEQRIGADGLKIVDGTGLAFDRMTGRNGDRTVWLAARGPEEAASVQKAIGAHLLEILKGVHPQVTAVKVLTTTDSPSARQASGR
jgi:hypothetical protein